MLVLMCPKCKNKMNYDSRDGILTKKKKKCVYCGHAYSVHKQIVKG